nr:hypothetical protein [Tanacetum cinerariifolium]
MSRSISIGKKPRHWGRSKVKDLDSGEKFKTSTSGEIVSLEKSNKNVIGLRILTSNQSIGRYDQDKDEDPSVGSDRGTKRRKSRKDAEPSNGSNSMESRSSSSSKGTQSQHKSSSKSTQAEKLEFEAADTEMYQDQRNKSGHIDDQPDNEAAPKHDWF